MGRALMALASEAKTLADNGYDTASTDAIIGEILAAFNDIEGSPYEAQLYGQEIPGFFLRDTVSRNDRKGVPESWTIGSDLESILYNNAPEYQPAMSNDQTLTLLVGWWAVAKWTTNENNIKQAQANTSLVMNYLIDNKYFIELPNGGQIPDRRGSDMRISSLAASIIADQISYERFYDRSKVEFDIPVVGDVTIDTHDLKALLLVEDVVKDLLKEDTIELEYLGNKRTIDIKPYSKNLVFMTTALVKDFQHSTVIDAAMESGHYSSVLYRSLAFGLDVNSILTEDEKSDMLSLYQSYPEDGPSNDPAKGAWSVVYQWSRVPSGTGDGKEAYTGLDFMAYENNLRQVGLIGQAMIDEQKREEIADFYEQELKQTPSQEDLDNAVNRLKEIGMDALKAELSYSFKPEILIPTVILPLLL